MRTNMQRRATSRARSPLAMPISLFACAMTEWVWILRSSQVVSDPAAGDFPECASAARALGVTCMFGVREMLVRRSSFVSPLMSHTHSEPVFVPSQLSDLFAAVVRGKLRREISDNERPH